MRNNCKTSKPTIHHPIEYHRRASKTSFKIPSISSKYIVSLEAIIVTFVSRTNKRTNVVHLFTETKKWSKSLGLPCAY
jgi:hypothetical protein